MQKFSSKISLLLNKLMRSGNLSMQLHIQSADRFLIRNINQCVLMNLIRAHSPVSRPQLATLSGLSHVTVLKITNNLFERDLIQKKKKYAESTGGRRAGL